MKISAFDIKERFGILRQEGVVYSHLGAVMEDGMNDVLMNMEGVLESTVKKRMVRKKLFHILIEITQNLYNYLENEKCLKDHRDMFILVREKNESYLIITGNYLLGKEIGGIKSRIDMVNSMSEGEIKEMYRSILDFGGVSQGGGAGLGFVDLARRSGENLVYKFEDIDEKFSFFTLEVSIAC